MLESLAGLKLDYWYKVFVLLGARFRRGWPVILRPMQASALLQQGFRPALRRAGIRKARFHDLPLVRIELARGRRRPRDRAESARPRERAHHAHDLRARSSEGATWCSRSHGRAARAEWKQSGNRSVERGFWRLKEYRVTR